MKFMAIVSVLALAAVSQLAHGAPTLKGARDIWDPKMTYPTSDTVWEAGQTYTVTWETTDQPPEITNPIGHINIRFRNIEVPFVLADNFDLRDGHVDVVAPLMYTDDVYSLVLYGDSGNIGPEFTINGFNV